MSGFFGFEAMRAAQFTAADLRSIFIKFFKLSEKHCRKGAGPALMCDSSVVVFKKTRQPHEILRSDDYLTFIIHHRWRFWTQPDRHAVVAFYRNPPDGGV